MDRTDMVAHIEAELEGLMGRRRRSVCALGSWHDLSLTQLHALMLLEEHGTMMISQLAQRLAISTPSATSIADRMEERALVRRVRDSVDRRVVHLEITPHGRDVVANMVGVRQEQVRTLLGVMEPEELAAVLAGLEAVRHAMDRLTAEGKRPA